MHFVNIHDAKTNLSKYIEQVTSSHEPIILCRNGRPIAQLTEYKSDKGKKLGILKGKIFIEEDFDQMPTEFMEYFE